MEPQIVSNVMTLKGGLRGEFRAGVWGMDRPYDQQSPEERCRRYRQLADLALREAQWTLDPKERAEQLQRAAAWHALVLDIETLQRTRQH